MEQFLKGKMKQLELVLKFKKDFFDPFKAGLHAVDLYSYLGKDEAVLKWNVRFQGLPVEFLILAMCDVELLEPLFVNHTLTYRFATDEDALGLVPELEKLVQSMFVHREDKLHMSSFCMEGMQSLQDKSFEEYVWNHSRGAPLKWGADPYMMADWLSVTYALHDKGITSSGSSSCLPHPYPFRKYCRTEFPKKQVVVDCYISMSGLALLYGRYFSRTKEGEGRRRYVEVLEGCQLSCKQRSGLWH